MKRSLFMALLPIPLLLGGCSTLGESTLLAAGIGAVAGSGLGLMLPPGKHGQYRARNVIVGGALGGLLGAGSGFLAHELIDKSNKQAYDKGQMAGQKSIPGYVPASGQPTLVPPRVETRFVEDIVRGGVFVPAHVEYSIIEPARWSR